MRPASFSLRQQWFTEASTPTTAATNAIYFAPRCRRSTQAEAVRQCLKGILGYLFRPFAELAVEVGIVERIDAALERFGVSGPIKEARCNAKRADWIIYGQCFADLLGL